MSLFPLPSDDHQTSHTVYYAGICSAWTPCVLSLIAVIKYSGRAANTVAIHEHLDLSSRRSTGNRETTGEILRQALHMRIVLCRIRDHTTTYTRLHDRDKRGIKVDGISTPLLWRNFFRRLHRTAVQYGAAFLRLAPWEI